MYSSGGFIGPTSPKSSEEIRNLHVGEIVTFLKNWQPSLDDMTEPSPEGFGRELAASVASDPERFAQDALQFQGLDPTYVRSLLSGLQEAAKAKQGFPWQPVLDLCQWVVQQPREISGRTDRYTHLDPGWVWDTEDNSPLTFCGILVRRRASRDFFRAPFGHMEYSGTYYSRRRPGKRCWRSPCYTIHKHDSWGGNAHGRTICLMGQAEP